MIGARQPMRPYRVANPQTPNGRRFAGRLVWSIIEQGEYVLACAGDEPGAMSVAFMREELRPAPDEV